MKPDDAIEFESALTDMMELLSAGKTELSARVSALWFRVLSPYPLPAVLAGMDAHMRGSDTGRTLPIPADIIKQINAAVAHDGRPGADEAWAIAALSVDERTTVVWTAEIAEAWGIARPIMALRDEVGARVAFREAYNRLVLDARCARRPVCWLAALGTDVASQESALRVAASQGRVDMASMAKFVVTLPAPAPPAETLLLAGDGEQRDADGRRGPNEADRARMADYLARMATKAEPISADAAARARTTELKAQSAERVAGYVTDNGQENR